MTVELIYDRDCPNVLSARANLVKAFAASDREARWIEWDRSVPDNPAHVRRYGSPTVLVDGKDVEGAGAGETSVSCRLYRNGAGRLNGAPSVGQIAAALSAGEGAASGAARRLGGWRSSLATMPGIAFAFLPNLVCPACWAAYAGLLSALGLGFLLGPDYLLPLTAALLTLAVGALALRARRLRRYGPLVVGLAAAIAVLAGKFAFDSETAMYGGIAGLVAASIWNTWPVRASGAGCPACVSESSSAVSIQHGDEDYGREAKD
jgi:mercuric ion transport protein